MNPRKLLVVDDTPEVRDFLLDTLNPRYDVAVASSGAEALDLLSQHPFDVLITDIAMPGMKGDVLIERVQKTGIPVVIIAISGYGTVEGATRLLRMGVFDYIEKPFAVERIVHTIDRAIQYGELKNENKRLQTRLCDSDRVRSLVGNSVHMQRIREKVRLVAGTRAAVLITGESGTGKKLVAREIHRMSKRASNPFVKIDCSSLPQALVEGELFGHDAADGALGPAKGKLELANTGTLLLEEIGELPIAAQSRLLGVLQDGRLERAGVRTSVKVDVRISATSTRRIERQIRTGAFREDLFYRLNVVPIEMPPLRERREDIPLLINHFVETFSRENNKPPIRLTAGATRKLCAAYWRGNVRELENVIERAVILAAGASLDENYFRFDDEEQEGLSRMEQTFRHGSIREMERLMILHRLQQNDQNRTRAAKSLDISVRTLRNKLKEYRESESARSDPWAAYFRLESV